MQPLVGWREAQYVSSEGRSAYVLRLERSSSMSGRPRSLVEARHQRCLHLEEVAHTWRTTYDSYAPTRAACNNG